MMFDFDNRLSDSPFVETIWHTRSEGVGPSFISVAATHWEMVVTRQYGHVTFTVRGPETKASTAPIPQNAEFLGIIFKLGTYMPALPVSDLVDGGINLPEAANQSFWLHGSTWQLPNFDNADTFVDRLVRQGLLTREPIVAEVLQRQIPHKDLSIRSMQRRFLRATGLTQGARAVNAHRKLPPDGFLKFFMGVYRDVGNGKLSIGEGSRLPGSPKSPKILDLGKQYWGKLEKQLRTPDQRAHSPTTVLYPWRGSTPYLLLPFSRRPILLFASITRYIA